MGALHNHSAAALGLAAPEPTEAALGLAPMGAACAAPGSLIGNQKDETPAVASGRGFMGQATSSADCARVVAERKAFATLRARLALIGWALSRTNADDGPVMYFASRWSKSRELADLAAVRAIADRVGAPQ